MNVATRLFPTGRAILHTITVARWASWLWMVGVVGLSGDALVHPFLAWVAVGAAAGFAAHRTVAIRHHPERLLSTPNVLAEVVFALTLTALDGVVFAPGHVFATSQNLATEWSLLAISTAGLALGPTAAAVMGMWVGPARYLAAEFNGFDGFEPKHFVSLLASSMFYVVVGAVLGWQAQRMRAAEVEIADRRARDEVARVIHDTVLQTLALVERRTDDRELAHAARDADRELRAFLFGSPRPGGRPTLRDLVSEEIGRARAGTDAHIDVNVVDGDATRYDTRAGQAIARAVGQAVANAVEHGAPRSIVIFAELDDDGAIFASVRDDGTGFNTDSADGVGIRQSIIGRMSDIGGRATVSSSPGAGTEVCLWSKA